MHLTAGMELIIHSPEPTGDFICTGFASAPVVDPTFIAVEPSGPDVRAAADLGAALVAAVGRYATQLPASALPCSGTPPFGDCHGLGVPTARKLLVLVVDPAAPITASRYLPHWSGGDPRFHLLPVVWRYDARPLSSVLPPGLGGVQAAFWDRRVEEVIPAVLRAAAVVDERPRVFLSYRRKDGSRLALQLFDELGRAGVDVFLDHARLVPGRDFLANLREELGDKSVLLALETATYLKSPWVRWEIGVAKSCGLGIIAVNVAGAPPVSAIDPDRRESLLPHQLNADGTIAASEVSALIAAIRTSHDRAILDRARMLRESFVTELQRHAGVGSIDVEGLQSVRVDAPTSYSVRIALRSPEVGDFYAAETSARGARPVVVALTGLLGRSRAEQAAWISDQSDVGLVDQSQIASAAADIASGAL